MHLSQKEFSNTVSKGLILQVFNAFLGLFCPAPKNRAIIEMEKKDSGRRFDGEIRVVPTKRI